MTVIQRHTSNLTLEQIGLTSRHSSQRNKKINTPPTHKKYKILLPSHIAHICLCLQPHKLAQRQSQKSAIAQRFIFHPKGSYVGDNQLNLGIFLKLKGKGWTDLTIFERVLNF